MASLAKRCPGLDTQRPGPVRAWGAQVGRGDCRRVSAVRTRTTPTCRANAAERLGVSKDVVVKSGGQVPVHFPPPGAGTTSPSPFLGQGNSNRLREKRQNDTCVRRADHSQLSSARPRVPFALLASLAPSSLHNQHRGPGPFITPLQLAAPSASEHASRPHSGCAIVNLPTSADTTAC
jgi:hypothetical protein